MSTPFDKTIRSLEGGRGRPWIAIAAALIVLLAWVTWFAAADVAVYETSIKGRIESDAPVRSIQAPIAGKVVASHIQVGAQVAMGDPLIELDVAPLHLEVAERRERLAGLESELALLGEAEALERAVADELDREGELAVREAQSSFRGTQAQAALSSSEARRAAALHGSGVASQAEVDTATARSASQDAERAALALRIERLRAAGRAQRDERRSRLKELRGRLASLRGGIETERAAIARLEHEIARRVIRAPAAGRLGSMSEALIGAYLEEGDEIATLIPEGDLRAVVWFPSSFTGRLRPGQAVTFRFPAYPWTVYGSRPGRVERVAIEPRDGLVQVDIAIEPAPSSPIVLEHGLEVSAEVTTERISPALLVLRALGGIAVTSAEIPGQVSGEISGEDRR